VWVLKISPLYKRLSKVQRCRPLPWDIAWGHLLKGTEKNRFTTAANKIRLHNSILTNINALHWDYQSYLTIWRSGLEETQRCTPILHRMRYPSILCGRYHHGSIVNMVTPRSTDKNMHVITEQITNDLTNDIDLMSTWGIAPYYTQIKFVVI
jgi:hypothetical protein